MNPRPLGHETENIRPPETTRHDKGRFYWVIRGQGAPRGNPCPPETAHECLQSVSSAVSRDTSSLSPPSSQNSFTWKAVACRRRRPCLTTLVGMMIRATVAMTTSVSGTTATHLTWAVVPGRPVSEMSSRTRIHAVERTTREGSTAHRDSGTRGSILATCSCGISTCRADTTERLFTMLETASTTCGARRVGPFQRSVPSGWSWLAPSAIITPAPPTRDRATCDTSVNKGSSEPSTCTVTATTSWS